MSRLGEKSGRPFKQENRQAPAGRRFGVQEINITTPSHKNAGRIFSSIVDFPREDVVLEHMDGRIPSHDDIHDGHSLSQMYDKVNTMQSEMTLPAPGGVEPPTLSLGGTCSIQLSYGAPIAQRINSYRNTRFRV